MPTLRLRLKPNELGLLKAALSGRGIAEVTGEAVLNEVLDRFSRQEWPSHPVPNVAGVVRDLNAGKNPQAHRFTARPTLIDTGALRDTTEWKVQNNHKVTVSSPASYSGLQHDGGRVELRLTQKGRRKLNAWLPRSNGDLEWLRRKASFFINVRPRKFLKFSDTDLKPVAQAILDHVEQESKWQQRRP